MARVDDLDMEAQDPSEGLKSADINDINPVETAEWLDSLEYVLAVSYTHLTLPTNREV